MNPWERDRYTNPYNSGPLIGPTINQPVQSTPSGQVDRYGYYVAPNVSAVPPTSGGSNSNNNGSTGGGGGGGNGPSQNDLLQQRLNGIMERLKLLRADGERLRGVAKGVRDEVIGNINTNYGGLQNAAMTKRDASTAELNKANTDVVSNYGDTQAQLVRASEATNLKNQLLARALGYGGGSYYQNMISGNNRNLEANVGKLLTERGGKLADISRGIADSNNWFNTKSTEIDQEATSMKNQAEREYQNNISKSLLAEQNYGIDSADAAAAAEADYRNKLSEIDTYAQNKANILANVLKAAGMQTSSINSRPNIDAGTLQSLSSNGALNNAQNADFGSISAPNGTLMSRNSMYGKTSMNKRNPWDEYIYGNSQMA